MQQIENIRQVAEHPVDLAALLARRVERPRRHHPCYEYIRLAAKGDEIRAVEFAERHVFYEEQRADKQHRERRE